MSTWIKKTLVAFGAVVLCGAILFAIDNLSGFSTSHEQPEDLDTIAAEIEIPPLMLFGLVIDGLDVVESEVKKNQRFTDLLEGYYVNPKVMRQIPLISRDIFDFRKVAAHKKFTMLVQRDSSRTARALVYESNPIEYVIFHFSDTLVVESCKRPTSIVERSIAAEINSNLSETIESMSISHQLTNAFVDIFAWQVDFQRLQKGDRFKLIYTEKQVEGKPIGIERIEAVYFEHFGSPYYAFPFQSSDEGVDYFDEKGNSLRKALLKYPIEFTRISSRFNPNRFHPVAKVFRAHNGTDFAAPEGTPIRAAGDGVVVEAQYKGGNGNYVKIRHNGTYTTQYLHMSKFGNGIRAGVRVRQGQTIGYVGSTGLASGPHLCYRFWKNGVQIDALKVQLPPAEPVKDEQRPAFDSLRLRLTRQLDSINFPEKTPEASI